jgi:hypothetical protein
MVRQAGTPNEDNESTFGGYPRGGDALSDTSTCQGSNPGVSTADITSQFGGEGDDQYRDLLKSANHQVVRALSSGATRSG